MNCVNCSAALALFIASPLSLALPADNQQPLTITSSSAEMHQLTHTAVYVGNVIAHHGSSVLTADQLTIQTDQDNQIALITAIGSPANFSTIAKINEKPTKATAQQIDYAPPTHTITLSGNATITRNQDSAQAEIIHYNTLTQTVDSPKQAGKRFTMIIQPSATR